MQRPYYFFLILALLSFANSADTVKSVVSNGISIEFSMTPASPGSSVGHLQKFQEGEDVTIRFRLTDTATSQPLGGATPAAWMDLVRENGPLESQTCEKAVKTFLEGSLFSRAELDLNSYYVLALNEDPTITVVDPLFSYGNSKLLALIDLKSPGDDWVTTRDQKLLFVSMPLAGQIAVIDAETWRAISNLDAGAHVNRLVIQSDGHYLWAASDFGVTVFSLPDLKVAARIATGHGPHWIVVGEDSRFAFVSNADAGTVSLIDIAQLEKVQDFKTGVRPTFLDYSTLSAMAYVSNEGDGTIVSIDGKRRKAFPPLQLKPGIGQVRFAPGGRYGFVVNPVTDEVFIFDAAGGQVLHTAKVEKSPDSITFSEKLAYVRHRGSGDVLMIPLDVAASTAKEVGVADFTAGRFPPGKMTTAVSADGIVQAPGELAVLVANPKDQMIYYYKEGMAAPMGSFSNYSREPRAVLVVDRSLKQQSPGVFQTTVKLRHPGKYRVAFFLDSPRVVQCFEQIEVASNPQTAQSAETSMEVIPHPFSRQPRVGERLQLQFELRDPKSGTSAEELDDVAIRVIQEPGLSQLYERARNIGKGFYEVQFTPTETGMYHVYFECPSRKLAVSGSRYLSLEVAARNGAEAK